MDATVKAYLGQVVQTASTNISKYTAPPTPPEIDGDYAYISTVASKLDAFFGDSDLTAAPRTDIEYITASYTSDEVAGLVLDLDSGTALTQTSPTGLIAALSDVADVTGTTPATTTFELPGITFLSAVTLPPFPAYTPSAPVIDFDKAYESAYLDSLLEVATATLESSLPEPGMRVAGAQLQKQRLVRDTFAVLAANSARGFKLPGSGTSQAMRDSAVKMLEDVGVSSKELWQQATAFIAAAQKLGLSVERLKVDFVEHLNELYVALVKYGIQRYEDAFELSLQQYEALIQKQAAQLSGAKAQILKSTFDLKQLSLSLALTSAENRLAADKAHNLTQFADLFKASSNDFMQERVDATNMQLFKARSALHEQQLNAMAEKRSFEVTTTVTNANKAVLQDKLEVLKSDLDAYEALVSVSRKEVADADAEWQKLKLEYANKMVAFKSLPPVLSASSAVVKSMIDSELTISKGVA